MLPQPNRCFMPETVLPQKFGNAPAQQTRHQMGTYQQYPNSIRVSSSAVHQLYTSAQSQNTPATSLAIGQTQAAPSLAQRLSDQTMNFQRPQGMTQYAVVTNTGSAQQNFQPQQTMFQSGQFQSNVIPQQQLQQQGAVQIRMVAAATTNSQQQQQQISPANQQGQQIIYQQQPQILTNVSSLQRLLVPGQIQRPVQQQVLINVPRQPSTVGGVGLPQQQQQYVLQQAAPPQRPHQQQHVANVPGVPLQSPISQQALPSAQQQQHASGSASAPTSNSGQSSQASNALFSQHSSDLDLAGASLPPLLTKQRLDDLAKEVDPFEQLDDDVKEALLQYADDFIESVATSACQLAKHRKSNTLEARDVQLTLERHWNMWIPGFGTDEPRPHKKSCVTEAHKQRMGLIKKTLRKI